MKDFQHTSNRFLQGSLSGRYLVAAFAILLLSGNSAGCRQSTLSNSAHEMRPASVVAQDSLELLVRELMAAYHIPAVSICLLREDGTNSSLVFGSLQEGAVEIIDQETMFSVGSISKVVTAVTILKLVDQGVLSLDVDINQYLTKWEVPASPYTRGNPVTLRRILSHTAGFTVHGFADFLPDEPIPTILQILNGEHPAKNEKVEVFCPVGSRFKYSGGGITVLQLLIEEVTGLPFHEAVKKLVFLPLELQRSSYENPLPASFGNIAKAHDQRGNPVALPRGYQTMPEAAASGLWTTSTDLARLLRIVMQSYHTEQGAFLTKSIVEDMMTAEVQSEFGLGPKIEEGAHETAFYHNGANDSYRAAFKAFLNTETGYIIFTNGTNGLRLIDELRPFLKREITSHFDKK